MNSDVSWNERYLNEDLPWETGRVDSNLPEALDFLGIEPCRVLELGCGTGNNAIWLAKNGYDVVAVDVSEEAVEQATEKARANAVSVAFMCADILEGELPQGPYDLVFDRGCFHSFSSMTERLKVASSIATELADSGHWLSLIGSADSQPREMGPPRLSAEEVARSVEESFEIVSLESTHFDSEQPEPPAAWCCMMRKRTG
jgi:SAM-dependent methyltransferase